MEKEAWCVKNYAEANHPPVIVVNGDRGKEAIMVRASAGQEVGLDASATYDLDDDRLSFRWWVYREAGSYGKYLTIENQDAPVAKLKMPNDAKNKSVHVVLEVANNGVPALTAYRRIVVDVAA